MIFFTYLISEIPVSFRRVYVPNLIRQPAATGSFGLTNSLVTVVRADGANFAERGSRARPWSPRSVAGLSKKN